jgi:DNA-directed RNA polymerase subunit RPC12/RpoP
MALYYYFCEKCNKEVKRLLTPAKAKMEQICKDCSTVLLRTPKDSSFAIKEVIDNGLQARRAEQFSGSAELLKEREHNARIKKYKTKL